MSSDAIFVDGAVTDNVPANLVDYLGADLVVATNPLPPPPVMKPEGLLSRLFHEINPWFRFQTFTSSLNLMFHDFGNYDAEGYLLYAPPPKLWPDDKLAEPIDRNVVPIYLLNLLPFGGLWAPLALNDDPDKPAMGGDIVLPYLVPYLGGCAINGCLGGAMAVVSTIIITGLASSGAGLLLVPCALVSCGGPTCLVVGAGTALQLWVAPSSSVNAWGRAYRKAADGLPEKLRPDDKDGPSNEDGVPDLVAPDGSSPEGATDQSAPPPAGSNAPDAAKPGADPESGKLKPEADGWVPF